jgi:hypothetical protein
MSGVAAWAQSPQKLADYQRVVVAGDARAVTQFAGEELASYAGRVAGKKIAVIKAADYKASLPGLSFFVGEKGVKAALHKELGPWKEEEFTIQTIPQGMILAGEDADGKATSISTAGGSRLAVYTLLDDHLGVKWFWPGPFGEHVPNNPGATIAALDIRTTPVFRIRSYSVGYGSYHTEAFREATSLWACRTRQGWVPKAWFGHSWYSAFKFKDKKHVEELLKTHPDWFALVNGKRQPPQMCTSNPEVIDHMVAFVLADKKNAITSISPSDGGGFCQCDRCRALDVPGLISYDGKTPQLSDRIFTYANEIARRVREKDPNKGVGMFAYTFYNKPPVRIKKLEPNIYLSFVHQAMANVDPRVAADWRQEVENWQKVSAHMIMREGWGNHYLLDLPFLHDREIISGIAFAAKRGFVGVYGEGSKAFSTQVPNSWAVTRMMWDPNQDTSHLMDDFYADAYGPVAPQMKHYWQTYDNAVATNWMKRRMISPSLGFPYVNIVNNWRIVLPESAIDQAEQYLRDAEAKAPAGEYADRVKFARVGQDYTRMMVELMECYRQLTEYGMKMDSLRTADGAATGTLNDPAAKQRLLKRAYELGRERETMLLAHRDWGALDEGLYAFTNDRHLRQWHTAVKKALGIDEPTKLTKELLK